ncbi:MAG: FeS-binding protein [Deltaproteobacteria bacterium]|nr:FeS-binding protein [Deltaproteobacteria bacterium]
MAFTGLGQMPIFKRYYIADIPGLGWSADFFLTHLLHYLGAILVLALFGYMAAEYALSIRKRYVLTGAGWIRVLLLAGIVGTGVVRVLKNLPDVSFSPAFTMLVDIAHLGLMMLFLAAALVFALMKRRWVRERSSTGA